MEIPIPQPDSPDIFSYGFDKSLNREIPSGNNPTVYDTVENAINTGSILVGNLSAARLNIGGFNSTAGITIYSEPYGLTTKFQTLKIDGANSDLVEGGDISITPGKSGPFFNGAVLWLNGGRGGDAGGDSGGNVAIQGGPTGSANGGGGDVNIIGGTGQGVGSGGDVYIQGGNTGTGQTGNVTLNTISGANINIIADNGDINIRPASSVPASGIVRFERKGTTYGGIPDFESLTADRTYTFPNRTGLVGIMGTFSVQLPAVAATTSVFSTVVSVTGIRIEDALTITRSDQGVSAAYATPTTAKIFYSAIPGNGQITMNFINLGAATGYTEHTFSYSAGSSAQ